MEERLFTRMRLCGGGFLDSAFDRVLVECGQSLSRNSDICPIPKSFLQLMEEKRCDSLRFSEEDIERP